MTVASQTTERVASITNCQNNYKTHRNDFGILQERGRSVGKVVSLSNREDGGISFCGFLIRVQKWTIQKLNPLISLQLHKAEAVLEFGVYC